MRIVTLNVGCARGPGLLPWIRRQKADVVCMQEIKAHGPIFRRRSSPRNLHATSIRRKAPLAVSRSTQREPERVTLGIGIRDRRAGPLPQLDFASLSVVSIYFPSGSANEAAQARKLAF